MAIPPPPPIFSTRKSDFFYKIDCVIYFWDFYSQVPGNKVTLLFSEAVFERISLVLYLGSFNCSSYTHCQREDTSVLLSSPSGSARFEWLQQISSPAAGRSVTARKRTIKEKKTQSYSKTRNEETAVIQSQLDSTYGQKTKKCNSL
jgi:hypothetical protein